LKALPQHQFLIYSQRYLSQRIPWSSRLYTRCSSVVRFCTTSRLLPLYNNHIGAQDHIPVKFIENNWYLITRLEDKADTFITKADCIEPYAQRTEYWIILDP
jgi:hypothetical protein